MITVITTTYNTEPNILLQALDSVLNQTYADIEFIVANDGSTNTTRLVLADFVLRWHEYRGDTIKTLKWANKGLSESLNECLKHASGDYILFMDADDMLSPYALEILHKILIENDADMSVGGISRRLDVFKSANNDVRQIRVLNNLEALRNLCFYPDTWLCHNQASMNLRPRWNKLYKAELFKNLRFPNGWGEDQATNYKLIYNSKKIAVTSKTTYFYRPNGKMSDKSCYENGEIVKIYADRLTYFEEKFNIRHLDFETELDDLTYKDALKLLIYRDSVKWYLSALEDSADDIRNSNKETIKTIRGKLQC